MKLLSKLVAVLICTVSTQLVAQQIGIPQLGSVSESPNDLPLIGFTLPAMPADEMQSLHDPSVLKDLEIVDEQRQEIEEIQLKFNDRFQALVRELMSSSTDPAKQEALRKELVDFNEERTDALSSVLLPHQLIRVKQITRQNTIEYGGGLASAIGAGELAAKLNINEEQQKKLRNIQKELQQEIAAKILECKNAARKRVLETLTVDQQSKLQELTGDKFVRRKSDRQYEHGKQSLRDD